MMHAPVMTAEELTGTGGRGVVGADDAAPFSEAVALHAVSQHAGDRRLLGDISFSIGTGQLVAIAGGSGAGKSTLLETMAGLRRPTAGDVRHGGMTVTGPSVGVGFVPQDDIVHRELPLRDTLRYSAQLRLPATTPPEEVEGIVDRVLRDLDLTDRADVRVGDLSGGQRKRSSVAVELLTQPRLFFLDEPTSGLDPATASELMDLLRRLASRGVTVVVTTHNPADIEVCDTVAFLAPGGILAYVGTPDGACSHFGVGRLREVYGHLATGGWAPRVELRDRYSERPDPHGLPSEAIEGPHHRPVRPVHQWRVLTRRNTRVLLHNRLTLAVLAGSPALVIAMMALLFPSGGFGSGGQGPTQTVFWVAFAGFFFGLTYGLLQIVGELEVFRRERLGGVNIGAYVASKITVLMPVLLAVSGLLLLVLRVLDRLPGASWQTYGWLLLALVFESLCALTLGLLASAAVRDVSQATLALPMLCFPQVLFAGAVIPVSQMASAGKVISFGMANRWAFESLGRSFHLNRLARATPTIRAYSGSFSGPAVTGCLMLAGFSVVFAVATVTVLRRRCPR